MNVIARLEYEFAYYNSAIHRFNHYTTRTPPSNFSSVEVPQRLFFWDDALYLFEYIPCPQILPLRWIFNLGNKKISRLAESGEYGEWCTCTILCFTKNFKDQKYRELTLTPLNLILTFRQHFNWIVLFSEPRVTTTF